MYENLYNELLNNLNDGNKCVLITYLKFNENKLGDIEDKFFLTEENIIKKDKNLDNDIYEKINDSISNGKIDITYIDDNKAILIEPFFPKPRLFVFGGGHIAKPLVEFASKVGFSITVIDDRPYFANSTRFPEAEKVICEDFQKSFDLIEFKSSDFVVIITVT